MNINFTVFTPTYNRGYKLTDCYNSLCQQTCKDFIWLIVDDGSTDNTFELVQKWKKENHINIEYIYQENGGKYRAVNKGIQNCKTQYFGFLDSDDYYINTTIEYFLNAFCKIEHNDRVAGVLARRGFVDGTYVGTELDFQEKICNYDFLVRRYNFRGDTCRAYKLSVLKNYMYPEINDRFILESVMLSAIDQKYDLYIINSIFSITDYLPDGYSRNVYKLYNDNPLGYALGLAQVTIAKRGILRKISFTIRFTVWCKKKKIKNALTLVKNKNLYLLLYPISMIFYLIKYPKSYFFDNYEKSN